MGLIPFMCMRGMKRVTGNEASVTYTIDNTAPTITHDGPRRYD